MQKVLTLAELETEVNRLAKKIGARESLLPRFGYSNDKAHPNVKVDASGYHYAVENGKEIERVSTDDLHMFLYHVFRPIAFTLASEFEESHHVEDQDSQEVIFKRMVELLIYISPVWGEIELKRAGEAVNTELA